MLPKKKIDNEMLLNAIFGPLLLSMFLLKWDFSTCKNYSKTTITGATWTKFTNQIAGK